MGASPTPRRFRSTLESRGGGTMLEIPFDVRAAFGRARPPVLVTIGPHGWRTTVAVYGGRSLVGVSRANREAAGIQAGDEVEVEIALDEAPREVAVPDDVRVALAVAPEAAAAFAALSYTHRRELVEWVDSARRAETRRRRVAALVDRLG